MATQRVHTRPGFSTVVISKRHLRWLRHWWRALAILAFFILGRIVTGIAAYEFRTELFENKGPETVREIFMAWSGELIFFTIVGLAVTIISIERPEYPESRRLLERIQILLASDEVPEGLLLFSRDMLTQSIAIYAETVTRKLHIEYYDVRRRAYLVRNSFSYILVNALKDTTVPYSFNFSIAPDIIPEPPLSIGRLISIAVDAEQKLMAPQNLTTETFRTSFSVDMRPSAKCLVEVEYELLLAADVDQKLISNRYTEYFEISFVNRLDFTPMLELRGERDRRLSLLFNQPVTETRLAVRPGEPVLVFALLGAEGTIQFGPQETDRSASASAS